MLMEKFILRLFIKYFFTENEKCLFIQALNLQKEFLRNELKNSIITSTDYLNDVKEINRFKDYFKNKLWN